MIDVGLFTRELQTNLHEARHSKKALLAGINAFFELKDVLFGGKEPSGTDEFGWMRNGVPIYDVRMVLPLLLFLSS